jgi:quercetin dioxygenase-like cupin family protein
MRTHSSFVLLVVAIVSMIFISSGMAHDDKKQNKPDAIAGTIEGLKIDNIMSEVLESVDGTEVVVSHIVVPPNTMLPKHWHPGEEFVYILDGTGILWQEGKEDVVLKKGDAYKVPYKQVHTAITKDESATILVFRVHHEGQPVRVNVE